MKKKKKKNIVPDDTFIYSKESDDDDFSDSESSHEISIGSSNSSQSFYSNLSASDNNKGSKQQYEPLCTEINTKVNKLCPSSSGITNLMDFTADKKLMTHGSQVLSEDSSMNFVRPDKFSVVSKEKIKKNTSIESYTESAL